MRCVGTNLHLKNKYGNGYKIEIRFVKEALETANTFVMNIIPKAAVLSTTKDTRVYQVLKTDVVLSEVFRAMQDRNDSIGILDYGVRQSSLEEVFLKLSHLHGNDNPVDELAQVNSADNVREVELTVQKS